MIYFKAAMSALSAAGILSKLLAGGAALLALLTLYGVWHHRVYKQGVDDTIAAIAREDSRLINRALAARGKWKECRDSGRNWDQTTGGCL